MGTFLRPAKLFVKLGLEDFPRTATFHQRHIWPTLIHSGGNLFHCKEMYFHLPPGCNLSIVMKMYFHLPEIGLPNFTNTVFDKAIYFS